MEICSISLSLSLYIYIYTVLNTSDTFIKTKGIKIFIIENYYPSYIYALIRPIEVVGK